MNTTWTFLATFCTSAQQPRIFSTQVLHPASKLRLAKLLLFFFCFFFLLPVIIAIVSCTTSPTCIAINGLLLAVNYQTRDVWPTREKCYEH